MPANRRRGWIAQWELTMARMPTAIVRMVCALPTMLPGAVNAQYPQRAILPANCELKLKDAAILFSTLELNDGCIVYFDPSIKQVKLTVVTLTLHGKSTIDLTPRVTLPPAPSKPSTPPQPDDGLPAQHGSDGTSRLRKKSWWCGDLSGRNTNFSLKLQRAHH